MNPAFDGRQIEDIADTQLSYQETTAAATGDPVMMDKVRADDALAKLGRLETAHRAEQHMLNWRAEATTARIERADRDEPALQAAIAKTIDTSGDKFTVTIDGTRYTERAKAAVALRDALFSRYPVAGRPISADCRLGGHQFGFSKRDYDSLSVAIAGVGRSTFAAADDAFKHGIGAIQRLENRIAKLPELLDELRDTRAADQAELARIHQQVGTPFPHSDELAAARKEVSRLQTLIDTRAGEHNTTDNEPPRPAGPGPTGLGPPEPRPASHQTTARPAGQSTLAAKTSAAAAVQRRRQSLGHYRPGGHSR